MKPNEQHIGAEIIAAYFAGELNAEARLRLETWVKSSEENRREFDAYLSLWQQARKEPDTEAALESVLDRIQMWENRPQAGQTPWYSIPLKVAAILLPLMVIGYLLYYAFDGGKKEELRTAEATLESLLPDGSMVTLNTNTVISYPKNLKGDMREVELEGEAYFDVARMPERPFIVQSGELQVKVLGTEFNVNAMPGRDSIRVDVSEGVVMLLAQNQQEMLDSVILKAGESGLFIQSERRLVRIMDFDPNTLFWKTGALVFNKTPLEDVVRKLEKAYDTNIVLSDTSMYDLRLTTTFEKMQLQEVMDIVSQTFALEWESTDTAIIIHAAGNGKE